MIMRSLTALANKAFILNITHMYTVHIECHGILEMMTKQSSIQVLQSVKLNAFFFLCLRTSNHADISLSFVKVPNINKQISINILRCILYTMLYNSR